MADFIVIDTETTWSDKVMSVGAVMADGETMRPIETRYFILDPEFREGGMYSDALVRRREDLGALCSRKEAADEIVGLCRTHGVETVFAYNARFDLHHLPEFAAFEWRDIMALAAYRQYNRAIPSHFPTCSTGRLKRGFGVESVLRMLSGDPAYRETHNALQDALDELRIMALLGHPLHSYRPINR